MSDAAQEPSASSEARWYMPLWEKILELVKEYGIAMMTGSVALFQWFLSMFFEGVGATDSLGLSVDRLLVIFVCAYTALPLLLIAHVAAAKESYRWPRILANVCLVLLVAIIAELLIVSWTDRAAQWPVGSVVMVLGSALVSWSQYRALAGDRSEKAGVAAVAPSGKKRGRLSLPLSRSQLVVMFGTLAALGTGLVGATLDNRTAYRVFHPCSATQRAPSALCLYEQMGDTLANGVVVHAAQRSYRDDARLEALFRSAQSIGFYDDSGPRSTMQAARRLELRARAEFVCDSLRLFIADADLQQVTAAGAIDTTKEARAKAESERLRRVRDESVLKQCAAAMHRADTTVAYLAAIQSQRKHFVGEWVRDEWAQHINLARRIMVLVFLAAGVVLALWVGGTTVFLATRVERQISTTVAILIFFVPLLPALQSRDMPILDPSQLFGFPQWSVVHSVNAPEPGRPEQPSSGEEDTDKATRDAATQKFLEELKKGLETRLDAIQGRFN